MERIYTHEHFDVKCYDAFAHFSPPASYAMRWRMTMRSTWIKALRRHLNLNQWQFAELFSVAQPTISRWEKGAEPEIDHWIALKEIATQNNFKLLDEGITAKVPLVGYVGAGAQVNLFAHGQGTLDEVDMPPGGTANTVAVEVRGESMSGIADDRWIIYYQDRREPVTEDLFGKLCVVGLANDGVLVKKLAPGRSAGRFDLYSTQGAPMFDQEVTWAARVEWIKPR